MGDAREIGPYDFFEKDKLIPLSLLDRAWVVLVLASTPAAAAYYAAKYYLTPDSEDKRSNVRTAVQIQVMKHVFRYVSFLQLRMVVPTIPMREELDSKLLSRKAKPDNYNKLFAVDNASARWLAEIPDRKKDDPVVLFLHGGAFMIKIMVPQVLWMLKLVSVLNARGRRVSVLAVDYTVTPYGKYPLQLGESTNVYKQLTTSCDKIIIAGDSAGGNLTAALLARISEQSLAPAWAAMFISPWMRLPHENETENLRDYLLLDDAVWRQYCSPDDLADPRCNPIVGSSEYWAPKIPERSICVWGAKEILRDSIQKWAEKAKVSIVYAEPKGVHDVTVLGPNFPSSRLLYKALDQWLAPPGDSQPPLPGVDAPRL